MYYIGFCFLNRFYAEPMELTANTPVVVTCQKAVLDASACLANKGVTPGRSVAEAKAILGRNATFTAWKEETFRPRQDQWLAVCEKFTDAIEPISQHAAYLDFSAHGDPLNIATLLASELEPLGFHPQIGIGGNKWTAELAAQQPDQNQIALTTPRRFVGPLPIACLPIEPYLVQRLQLLGCHQIGDILAIPMPALRAQFGDTASSLRRFALGGGDPIVKSVYPKGQIAAVFWPSGPIEDLESLKMCFEVLAQRLSERLNQQDQLAHQVILSLEREDQPPLIRKRTFSKPIFDALTAQTALLALSGELHEPCQAIRCQLRELEPRQRHQPSLEGRPDEAAQKIKVDQAVQAMRKLFGDESVRPTSALVTARQLFLRAYYDEHCP